MMKDNPDEPEYDEKMLEVVLIVINSAAFVALLVSIFMLHPALRKRFAARLDSKPVSAEVLSTNTKVAPAAPQKVKDTEKGTTPAEDRNWKSFS